MTFDVRLLSLDATTGRDPVEALVQVFRLDRGRAEQLARRLPYVVKRGVSLEQAERVMQALRQIGGHVELLPSALGEPTEGSLVAPLPLEPPSPFGRTHNTSTEAALVPRQNAGGRSAPHTDTRLRTSRQHVFAEAATGRQDGRASAAARSGRQAQYAPRSPAGQPSGAPVRPRGPATHDNLEADISAVIPESTKGHGYPRTAQQAPQAAEQTGRVSSYGMTNPQPSERGKRGYGSSPGAQESQPRANVYAPKPPVTSGRSSAYGMGRQPPEAAPGATSGRNSAYGMGGPASDGRSGRSSTYGMRQPPSEAVAQPRSSYGLPPVNPGLKSPRPMFAPTASPSEAARAYASAEEAGYRTVPYGSGHAVAEALPPHARQAHMESSRFGEPASVVSAAPVRNSLRGAVANDVQRVLPPTLAEPASPMLRLPQLAMAGAHVTAKHQVVPGTANAYGWALVVLFATGLLCLALGLLVPYGYAAGIVFTLWLFARLTRGLREMSELRTRGIPLGQGQLSEIYACVKQFSVRLELSDVPLIYLTRGGVSDVRARRRFSKLALELDEGFVCEVLRSARPEVLSFHIARALACHVLGHSKALRRLLSSISSGLARRDVLSADATATALVVDRAIARAALVALVARNDLAHLLDVEELERAATSLRRDGATFRGDDPERCFMGRLDAFLRGYR